MVSHFCWGACPVSATSGSSAVFPRGGGVPGRFRGVSRCPQPLPGTGCPSAAFGCSPRPPLASPQIPPREGGGMGFVPWHRAHLLIQVVCCCCCPLMGMGVHRHVPSSEVARETGLTLGCQAAPPALCCGRPPMEKRGPAGKTRAGMGLRSLLAHVSYFRKGRRVGMRLGGRLGGERERERGPRFPLG